MFKRAIRLAAIAMAIVAAGCSGSDGTQGPQGPQGAKGDPGPIGQPLSAESCTACHSAGAIAQADQVHDAASLDALAVGSVEILSVDFTPDGASSVKPTVQFRLKDRNNADVVWDAFNLVMTRLVPATATVPEHWEAVTASRENGGNSVSSKTAGSSLTSAAGVYTYKFGQDLVTFGKYQVGDTIRLGIQLASYASNTPSYDMATGVADFTAAAAVVTPNAGLAREIATAAACNGCHGKLVVHGRRVGVNYCGTCHLYGLTDANGSGDLTQFIHKLHGREALKSPTTPIFKGLVPAEITYPQSIANCDTCHKGAAGARWNTNPSRYACTSCHDGITFDAAMVPTLALHTGGARANDSQCAGCHSSDDIKGYHADQANLLAKEFVPSIVSVTPVAGKYPTVKFKISNAAGTSTYALSNAAFRSGGSSSLSVLVGFANTDVQNVGIGNYGQPLNVNLLTLTAGAATPNASGYQLSSQLVDGSYVLTIDQALPTGVTASTASSVDGTVAIQGHPAGFDPVGETTISLPMKNVSKQFRAKGTGTASARRTIVDINKCNACHANLSLHGGNRTGDITTCTLCHNTEATDGSRRPAGALGIDGNAEEGIDFKYMIHKIHGHSPGNGIVVYGFNNSVNDFREVTYPGVLSDCKACHVAGAYLQPSANANATSVFSGANKASGTDNLRTSKYLATCGGCHDSGAGQGHIQQMGGNSGYTQSESDAVAK